MPMSGLLKVARVTACTDCTLRNTNPSSSGAFLLVQPTQPTAARSGGQEEEEVTKLSHLTRAPAR